MIDDEFSPDQFQLEVPGKLFTAACNRPAFPVLRETTLYEELLGQRPSIRPPQVEELAEQRLIEFANRDANDDTPANINVDQGAFRDVICLTPAGIFFCASRPDIFAENAYGLTRDLSEKSVDAIWSIYSHFRPKDLSIPASDRTVRINHNSSEYEAANRLLREVISALAADNEIGANFPKIRDQKLQELADIRDILSQDTVSQTRLAMMGWGALGYLATEFADRPVGHLADLAWEALKALIGI